MKLTLINLKLSLINLKLSLINLKLTLINLKLTLINLKLALINLKLTLINLNVTLINLNLSLINLRVKRCIATLKVPTYLILIASCDNLVIRPWYCLYCLPSSPLLLLAGLLCCTCLLRPSFFRAFVFTVANVGW